MQVAIKRIADFQPDCVQLNGFRVETLLAYHMARRHLRGPTLLRCTRMAADQAGPGSLIDRRCARLTESQSSTRA